MKYVNGRIKAIRKILRDAKSGDPQLELEPETEETLWEELDRLITYLSDYKEELDNV